jgi:OOP family OmpA-OmpF porin
MTRFNSRRLALAAALTLGLMVFFGTSAAAQSTKVEGLIKARKGDTMLVQTSGSGDIVVLLTDNTKVGQVQGMFKARKKEMSMAALIPGLAVKVEGIYNDQKQLEAKSVSFKGNDLEEAETLQAGMHESKVEAQKQKEELAMQQAALQQQQAQLTEHQQKIAANKAAIDAAVARFGELDDYYILDEVTINFDNGKTTVNPKYVPQLLTMAEKAKGVEGYVIEVKGYASSVGGASLNQRLSEDRANKVANILIQQGHISLTRMLAPGAMGESNQVGNDKTAEGQAENRRVVVRVLQNKAIAGI